MLVLCLWGESALAPNYKVDLWKIIRLTVSSVHFHLLSIYFAATRVSQIILQAALCLLRFLAVMIQHRLLTVMNRPQDELSLPDVA